MFARIASIALAVALLPSLGAGYRTQNFIVSTQSPQLAKEIGDAAEAYRRDLAIEWLGAELPPWGELCPIEAQVAPNLGAGGATSFMFQQRRPFGWTMSIQGTRERVLDSVLPHEITHTIFATYFGRPLPRWADEGACTTVEHASEKGKQEKLLIQFLTTNRGIPFNQMFAMKDYPPDILPLYSQGFSLAKFLIYQGGKRKFVDYVGEGMDRNNWGGVTKKHYGYDSLGDLQVTWLEWVKRGAPNPLPADLVKQQIPGGDVMLVSSRGDMMPPQQMQPSAPPAPPTGKAPAGYYASTVSANASAATTPTNFAAQTGGQNGGEQSVGRISNEGWYAKQRDAGRSELPTAIPAAAPVTAASAAMPATNSVAPPAGGRQVLLEWRRGAGDESVANARQEIPDWSRGPASVRR